jgi:hypothetical protein
MKEMEFTLSDPIKYQTGGEHVEGVKLELTAPAVKNRKRAAKLKQGFMRCINDLPSEAKKSPEKKQDAKLNPDEVLVILQMGSIEYDEYIDIFVNLLSRGVCKIDGKEDLTELLAEKISFEDLERLMGEYIVNFILGSLMETAKK